MFFGFQIPTGFSQPGGVDQPGSQVIDSSCALVSKEPVERFSVADLEKLYVSVNVGGDMHEVSSTHVSRYAS